MATNMIDLLDLHNHYVLIKNISRLIVSQIIKNWQKFCQCSFYERHLNEQEKFEKNIVKKKNVT